MLLHWVISFLPYVITYVVIHIVRSVFDIVTTSAIFDSDLFQIPRETTDPPLFQMQ